MKGVKTALLLGAMSGLLLLMGHLAGGSAGVLIALGLAVAMNGVTYWKSDAIALRMARAEPAEGPELRWYHDMVERLAQQAGIPKPRLYVSPSPQPNAFATGRSPQHAAVCLNAGLIELLDRDELEGVVAHELSHVGNRDVLIGTVAATLASAITSLAYFLAFFGGRDSPFAGLAMLLLAPISATLIQLAVTRSRETRADASGAELTGKPLALANALRKLEAGGRARRDAPASPAEASNAYATLYISPPGGHALSGGGASRLFRTHPTTDERVARLEQLARERGQLA